MANQFATFIIAAQDAPLARQIAGSFGSGGYGMWTTALSPTGAEPATHYISSGKVPSQFIGMLTNPAAVAQAATSRGIPLTLEQVQGILTRADVTAEKPFDAMARLGLQFVQPPEDDHAETSAAI